MVVLALLLLKLPVSSVSVLALGLLCKIVVPGAKSIPSEGLGAAGSLPGGKAPKITAGLVWKGLLLD